MANVLIVPADVVLHKINHLAFSATATAVGLGMHNTATVNHQWQAAATINLLCKLVRAIVLLIALQLTLQRVTQFQLIAATTTTIVAM